MSALLPFLVIDQTCEQVQEGVKHQLTEAGYRIVQTFDLHVARHAHTDCSCPYHGTNDCTCQLVVLLVYQNNEDPATLIIHGQDDRTWLSLATPTGQRSNQHLEMMIRRVLTAHATHTLVPHPVPNEVRAAI